MPLEYTGISTFNNFYLLTVQEYMTPCTIMSLPFISIYERLSIYKSSIVNSSSMRYCISEE